MLRLKGDKTNMMMAMGFNPYSYNYNPTTGYPTPAYGAAARSTVSATAQSSSVSYEQQNDQLRTTILSSAQQLGFTDTKELQTLNARLAYAQVEVSNVDPTKALNLRQKAQTDAKAQNKILSLALKELQESSSQNSMRLKMGTLIEKGEMPDEIAPNTFISYNVKGKASENELVGVFDVEKTTTKVVTDAKGKQVAHRSSEALPIAAVDALSPRFEVMDAEKSNYTGLSSDTTDAAQLGKALQAPQQQQLIQQLAGSLSVIRQTKDYDLLQQLVTPLEKTVSNVYGLQEQGIEFQTNSPDGGSTFALFDPASNKVKIIAPAIEGLFKVGERSGLSGEALNQYVATELVGTLSHETRHAYQYQVTKEYQQSLDNSNPALQAQAKQTLVARGIDLTKDKPSLEALSTNWRVYVAPNISQLLNGSQADYKHQPLEEGVEAFEEQGKRAAKTAFQGVLMAGKN
jgi:hypothetical protein